MKTLNTILAALFTVSLLASCKSTDTSYMQYNEQMKDSIFKAYPTVNSVTIEEEDGAVLKVTLGDAHLFSASPADRQKVANEIGMMALRIFPKDNNIDKGQLLVSKDEKSVEVNASQAQKCDINIDSLRKVTNHQ